MVTLYFLFRVDVRISMSYVRPFAATNKHSVLFHNSMIYKMCAHTGIDGFPLNSLSLLFIPMPHE